MAIACIPPQPGRRINGYADQFINPLKKYIGDNPTIKDIRTIIKRLGTDDVRMLDIKTTDGKKLIGKNLDVVKEWDSTKGSVPPQTVVKVTNPDGSQDYFISNRKTSTPPSRWIVNGGKVVFNHDWAAVSKNATIDATGEIKPYVRVKGQEFRPAKDGEEGVFLNIQRPYEGKKKADYKLAEQGYDAVKTKDGYRVFDSHHQASEPSRLTLETKYEDIGKVNIEAKEVAPEEIVEELTTLGIGKKVAYGLAGSVAGQLMDQENDWGGKYIGGGLGLLLGTQKFRTSMLTSFPKLKDAADKYDVFTKSRLEAEKVANEAREAVIEGGYRGDVKDAAEIATFKEQFLNSMKATKKAGGNIKKLLVENDYFQSARGFLKNMPSSAGKQLLKDFNNVEIAGAKLFERWSRNLEKHFGDITPDKEFAAIQEDVMRRVAPELANADSDVLLDQFGSAIHRIITHEGQLKDGVYRYASSDAADNVYRSVETRNLDESILKTEEGQKALDALKDTFEEFRLEAELAYRDQVYDLAMETPEFASVLIKALQSGVDMKTFEKTIATGDVLAKFQKGYKQDKAFLEGLEFIDRIVKLDQLKGRYMPQVYSYSKADVAKKKYLKGVELDNPTPAAQQEAWERHQAQQILALNKNKFLHLEPSSSGDDLIVRSHRTLGKAINELKYHEVQKINDTELRREVLEDLANGKEMDYIGAKIVGNKEVYFIKNPQKYADRGINILDDVNETVVETIHRLFMNTTTLKRSNFLDNPRNYVLPTEMLETNINNIMRMYTQDAGVRLQLLKDGLGTDRQLKRRLSTIRKELEGKVEDSNEVERMMGRVKSWYANITDTSESFDIGKTPGERAFEHANMTRTNKILSTLKNLGYMPFLYATTLYSPYQPFILGPFLARWGNLAKTTAHYFKNPQDLKIATRELEKMGVIQHRISAFAPEMEDFVHSDLLKGSTGDMIDYVYSLSQKGVNMASKTSLARPILKSMGIDLENTGLLRLAVGDMLTISQAESGLMTMAVFREVEEMVDALHMMKTSGKSQATISGTTIKESVARRKLEELGVTNVDSFVSLAKQQNDALQRSNIEGYMSRFKGEEVALDEIPSALREELTGIADTTINQYHGRTRLSRPLTWTNNPKGRLLSQFSVYSQNFAVQTVQKRMIQPLRDWNNMYRGEKADNTPLMKIMWYMRTRNDKKLKEIFGDNWEKAVDDFPTDAVNNILKVTPAVLGVGKVMLLTRGAVIDVLNMAGNEAIGNDDYEAWKTVRRNMTFGAYGKDEDKFTIADVFSGDTTGFDIAKVFASALHHAAELSFGGRAAQIFINESRFNQDGVWSKTPVTGMLNEAFNVVTAPFRYSLEDAPAATAKEILDFTLLRAPFIGTFNDFRRGLSNAIFDKPKNRDITFTDAETGFELSDFDFTGFD